MYIFIIIIVKKSTIRKLHKTVSQKGKKAQQGIGIKILIEKNIEVHSLPLIFFPPYTFCILRFFMCNAIACWISLDVFMNCRTFYSTLFAAHYRLYSEKVFTVE